MRSRSRRSREAADTDYGALAAEADRVSTEWNRAVLDMMEDAVFVLTDDVATVLDVNTVAEELFEADRETLIAHTTLELSRDSDREALRVAGDAFSSGKVAEQVVSKVFVRPDGSTFRSLLTMTAVPHPAHGRVVVCRIDSAHRKPENSGPTDFGMQTSWRNAYSQVVDEADGPAPMTIAAVGIRNIERSMERLGWTAGKALSGAVLRRVSETLGASDIVVELYGGTIAVLMRNVTDPEVADALVSRMISMFDHPVFIGGESEHVEVQAGAVCLDGSTVEADAALTMAVVALNAARASGSPVSVFDPDAARRRRGERALEDRICAGIRAGLVRGAIQPIVSLENYEMVGVEALARLHLSPVGNISPDAFISLASQRGLIPKVTEQVLADGFDAVRRLGSHGRGMKLSLNVSGEQLVAGFPDWLEDHRPLYSTPEDLQIEVTESVLIERQESLEVLHQLAEAGYQIAIDDFGTGYSSLTYLSEWPAHVVKLDKSFVGPIDTGNERSMSIVRSVIDLAREMDLITVAEGVERPGQLELLRSWGCDRVQGYLLSAPVWPDQIQAVYEALADTAELVQGHGKWTTSALETPISPISPSAPHERSVVDT